MQRNAFNIVYDYSVLEPTTNLSRLYTNRRNDMKIGSVSLNERTHVMWLNKDFLSCGFKGVCRYLLSKRILVLCHPEATQEELIASLITCAKQLKGGGIS